MQGLMSASSDSGPNGDLLTRSGLGAFTHAVLSRWDIAEEIRLAQAWLDDLGDEGEWAPNMSAAYMQGGAYILSKVCRNPMPSL